MDSLLAIFITERPKLTWADGVVVLGLFIGAYILIRVMKMTTRKLVEPALSRTRVAQMREQQTRTIVGVLNSAGVVFIIGFVFFNALSRLGIETSPFAVLAGLGSVALGFGAQTLVRDVISGILIVFEDQFIVGDTIQVLDTAGRVEHFTLRRTILRDDQGALVTIGNGEIRKVANQSRDWSQIYVDFALAPDAAVAEALALLEKEATNFRADATWSPSLVDGPRVLGVEQFRPEGCILRIQIRTLPTRQHDVARELRRRIQNRLAEQKIPLTALHRVEYATGPVRGQDGSEVSAGPQRGEQQGGTPWDK
ncbi:MAG TPA: mechanosensitive ion channel domain-containing protein [Candidatus Dormibacteraeota bacterium]|nr:mechanosensitive ion channel domain-containing protein [Candidatus Dormibacteraeota bacterium]